MTDNDELWWLNELFGTQPRSLSKKQKTNVVASHIDFIESLIQSGSLDDLWIDEEEFHDGKLKRTGRTCKINYWQTTLWGEMLMSPDIKDPLSKCAREFRRRFRIPYPVFEKILVPECDRLNVFEVKDYARVRLPTEFKILICLRILGRGAYHDDIANMARSFKSTCNTVFRQFVRNFTPSFYKKFVIQPTGEKRKKIMDTYAKIGLHGCLGSMDATHIFWARCPPDKHSLCTGKGKNPLLRGIVLWIMHTEYITFMI